MLRFEEQQQNISPATWPLWKLLAKSWRNCCLNQWMSKSFRTLKMYRSIDKTYSEETVLPEDGLYIYLYQPGRQHGDQKRRATDLIWIKNTYRLHRIVQDRFNCVLYYLQDGPDRAIMREVLMHVSEGT